VEKNVGDHDYGLAQLVHRPAQESQHPGRGVRVEVAGGLVGKNKVRLAYQRSGAGNPLLLAA
jgi:hypothetical protein